VRFFSSLLVSVVSAKFATKFNRHSGQPSRKGRPGIPGKGGFKTRPYKPASAGMTDSESKLVNELQIQALGANFSAHEYDVGNAETDRNEAKQGRDMRPDQSHALFERQRRRQDSFGLAR
jgi:hypothetical protein